MLLFLVHYCRCLQCHVCITYINVCTEDVISKDVTYNSHRFIEDIQNFFLTQCFFTLHDVLQQATTWNNAIHSFFSATNPAAHHFTWKHLPVLLDCSGITLPCIIFLPALALKHVSEKLPLQKALLWLLKCRGPCEKYELHLDTAMCFSLPKIWSSLNDKVNWLRLHSNYPCSFFDS